TPKSAPIGFRHPSDGLLLKLTRLVFSDALARRVDRHEIASLGAFAVKFISLGLAIGLLALMPARGDDPPKKAKKNQTPKEQFDALVREFNEAQATGRTALAEAKGDERQKLALKGQNLGTEFADKFYKLAEEHPKDPVASEALFWIMQNGAGSSVFAKA